MKTPEQRLDDTIRAIARRTYRAALNPTKLCGHCKKPIGRNPEFSTCTGRWYCYPLRCR